MTTKEQVIAWAREAAAGNARATLNECYALKVDELEKFATLVRNATLDEAAQRCDGLYSSLVFTAEAAGYVGMATRDCAQAIRNLKEPT